MAEEKTGTSEAEATPDAAEKTKPDAPAPGKAPKVSEVDARPDQPVRSDPEKD